MKANEAPEKIYVQLPSRKWIGRIWDETPIKEGDNPNWKNATNIEYIRTDAFIEKAYKFFAPYIQDNSGGYDRAYMYERFKNYMKGE